MASSPLRDGLALALGFSIRWLASAAALCVRNVRTMTLDAHAPLGTD